MERIEVIISVQRRRRYSVQEKAQFVAMTMQPGSSVSSIARQYGISPSLLFKWKRLIQDGGVTAVEANDQVVSVSDYNALLKKVKQLEQMLGRKTVEAEILKDALEIAQTKKVHIAHALITTRRYPTQQIAQTLGVSRSNLYRRMKQPEPVSRLRYCKADDMVLLPIIREICDQLPSNGYRRVTAHLNRRLKQHVMKLARVNPKRIYQIMKQNQSLIMRAEPLKNDRTHDGRVEVFVSNSRWCSDGFEIKCWNGEKVRAIFSLDCCDREVMSYLATTTGISSDMVCDVLVQSMEKRFGAVSYLPHPIEWLTDNGSCYIAKSTRQFAHALGFRICTTPIRSPQSNGMAEAFIKTFKRDYVYLNDMPDAATVLNALPVWIEDYNSNHPHSGLKMKSPREFLSLKLAS
ncbi:IS3 family transposase [Acinetobacter sp. ANC 4282]|uniref:IS3 family transposase n=1 Tax=Acinetobacter terrae TaxID=2731247 RepID=A0A8E4FEK7_9GAMM|nr:IS3 family transposase [Acinetobacter terrae]NNH16959.1 IS3 family transposase [Acinetobacter terrae]NNH39892.1 IS3 family transposase [Acinetobacter terrae]NNH88802.1 IS3 family transposase [Acinetobacter terrae]